MQVRGFSLPSFAGVSSWLGCGAPRHVLKLLLVAFARTLGRSGQIEVPALHGRVLNRN